MWMPDRSPTAALASIVALISPLAAAPEENPIFYIREYRVSGSTKLSTTEIQETVYPFLGPARTADDVEKARLALEASFRQKGYETVSVLIPQQDPRYGVIRLEVVEGKVGRLRVHGAKWFLPGKIKQSVPSLAEGSVPNLQQTRDEIVSLNRLGDRQVVPSLRAGTEPGTVDIDLSVEDKMPLHGSLELNNRYSIGTTHLRLNGSLSYSNLFQLGHTIGGSFQVAPENTDDSLVYSAFYLARLNEKVSLMLQGSRQESDISTLGGSAVAGNGDTLGVRLLFDLPGKSDCFQTFTLGLDWKRLEETTYQVADSTVIFARPLEYFPLTAAYTASKVKDQSFTELNLTTTLHLRGFATSDGDDDFDYRRFRARASFIHLRADLSHTVDLADDSQLFGKIQGQIASGPLINAEQFAGGGLGNARGYLESEALGDNGIFATFEYRTPSLIGVEDENGKRPDEWRFHAFLDAGIVGIYDSLPGQDSRSTFASAGVGTRVRYRGHFHGSVDFAFPLVDEGSTDAFDPRITFRGWADF